LSLRTPPDPHPAANRPAVAATAVPVELTEHSTRPGARFYRPDVQQRAWKMRHEDELPVTEIAAMLGCSNATVYDLTNGHRYPARRYPPITEATVRRYHNGEETIDTIAARIGCVRDKALRMLIAAGAEIPADVTTEAERRRNDIVKRYTNGDSIRQIAAALSRSYGYVHYNLVAAHVKLRPRGNRSSRPNPQHREDPPATVAPSRPTPPHGAAENVRHQPTPAATSPDIPQ